MATNFFISYNTADKIWAEWVAWQLEDNGYTTVIQAWDFKAGSNFVLEMAKAANAERTIAILSDDYIKAEFTKPEWAAAFAQDPTGENCALIPVRVKKCEIPALLKPVVYIDLVGKGADSALQALLQQVKTGRAKPAISPKFPGTRQESEPEFPGKNMEMSDSNDGLPQPKQGNGESIFVERKIDSANFDKQIQFQNKIRNLIEKELAKDMLKPLREGLIEIVWRNSGKLGDPTALDLVNELFVIDPATQCADLKAMLEILRHSTEACLVQLEDKGEEISASDIIWRSAKQILGLLVTLAVRSEELAHLDGKNGFEEIDVETMIGVEIYTARKKEHPANFQIDTTASSENFRGDKQLDLGVFPETGWQAKDVIDQIWLIVWKAVGNKERSTALSEVELKQLNETLRIQQTRRKNSLNYHFAVRKSFEHPLLIPEICQQIKMQLPELSIVHIGTESNDGSLLMISEGILIAQIEAFLSLIEQYQSTLL